MPSHTECVDPVAAGRQTRGWATPLFTSESSLVLLYTFYVTRVYTLELRDRMFTENNRNDPGAGAAPNGRDKTPHPRRVHGRSDRQSTRRREGRSFLGRDPVGNYPASHSPAAPKQPPELLRKVHRRRLPGATQA